MTKEEILTKVMQLIAKYAEVQPHKIDIYDGVDYWIPDELRRVEWVMELEQIFGISINDNDGDFLIKNTVGHAVDKLWRLVG